MNDKCQEGTYCNVFSDDDSDGDFDEDFDDDKNMNEAVKKANILIQGIVELQ